MKIWLDDIRSPPDSSWEIARNNAEFLALIQFPDLITEISFDHDLGDDQVCTGADLARSFISRCLDFGTPIPLCHVHSANPPGKANIISIINSGLKVQRLYKEN